MTTKQTTALRDYTFKSVDCIDSSMFTGDQFNDKEAREEMRTWIKRWTEQLNACEDVAGDVLENLFQEMKTLVEDPNTDFSDKWDDFWELSSDISDIVLIDWYDPDTTYEEDIMARYRAVKEHIEEEK